MSKQFKSWQFWIRVAMSPIGWVLMLIYNIGIQSLHLKKWIGTKLPVPPK